MRSLQRDRGFTLVELLIVVVVLAILAAMAIPAMKGMASEARHAAFASDLHILAEAAGRYHAKHEQHLPDTSSGVWPSELDGYIKQQQFEAETPLGGVWDTELNSFGVTAAIGAHFNGTLPADSELAAVDAQLDDGDLTTGTVRKLASGRFYYVLEE